MRFSCDRFSFDLFGLGLAALAGSQYVGQARRSALGIPFSQIPVVGRALFSRPLVYLSIFTGL